MPNRSPCYGCPDRNYAAGCAKGCERREEWLKTREENGAKKKAMAAPGVVLNDTYIKRKKAVHKK